MTWRKWTVRSLVFLVAGILAAGAFLYSSWTNPTVVREQVLARLRAQFSGATVSLDSARLKLFFGGISVSELHLTRRDRPGDVEFAYIPQGVISLDKEMLSKRSPRRARRPPGE